MTLVQSSVRTIHALFARSGFHPIPNFKTKNAQDAFQNYEGARSKITPKAVTTQIRLSQATYNYVEFKLELLETPSHELEDGLTAFARRNARLNLTLVSWRVKCSKNQIDDFAPLTCSEKFPDVLDWGIPCEIVALADYGGNRKCDSD